MIEERLVLRREDFLDLRKARKNPQNTSGVIAALKHEGIIYSSGVFPRSAERSFVKALEEVDCYEILGDFNSIIIPYICGDTSDAFAEILEMYQRSAGILDEFCFVRERETRIYTPVNELGIVSLQSIPCAIAGDKRLDSKLALILREQNQVLSNYLGGVVGTVECH